MAFSEPPFVPLIPARKLSTCLLGALTGANLRFSSSAAVLASPKGKDSSPAVESPAASAGASRSVSEECVGHISGGHRWVPDSEMLV